jgi:septal ring factor EnvC (AmiA/AmiB activator)
LWATVSITPPRNLTHPYLPSIFAIQSHSTFLKEEDYNKSLEKYKETISQHESKIESFYEQMKQLKDAIMERTKEMDGVRIELTETKKKCDEQIGNISKEVNIISGRYCN